MWRPSNGVESGDEVSTKRLTTCGSCHLPGWGLKDPQQMAKYSLG